MSNTEKILEDLARITATSKEFIGEFIYAPFGIESSEVLNSLTLYFALGVLAMIVYRISRPAPHARYRRPVNNYDYGRNI